MAAATRQVALVGAESEIFSSVQERLVRHEICEVVRFPNIATFAGSGAASATAVLYAPGHMRIEAALAAAPELRAVLSPFTGIDGFNLEAATRATVVVGNAPTPENFESMAEATLMLILACLYDLPGKTERLANGGDPGPMTSRMLKGKRVGMIGFGRIARALAERLSCFGAINQAFSRQPRAATGSTVQMIGLEELLTTSDVVCVMTTLNQESRGMLDARRLALCKRDAILVNVARGGLIDEEALYALAARGHFARIALDVFAVEPLPMDSPLRSLPNAILTPHAIGHTLETHQSLIRAGLESIQRVLLGASPLYPCNPEVLPAWHRRWNPGLKMNAQLHAESDRTLSRLAQTELERRWALLRNELRTRNIEALVVLGCEDFMAGPVRWLTDRAAYATNSLVAIFHAGDLMTLIEHGPSGRRRSFKGEEPDYPGVGEVINAAAFQSARSTHRFEAEFVLAEFARRGYRRIALAGAGVMPYAFVDALMNAGLEVHDLTDFMDLCRARKSDYELDLIRKTAAMQDRVFTTLLKDVRPGMRDMDVVTRMMSEGRREGSEQAVFLAGSAAPGAPAMMRSFHYQARTIGRGDALSVLIENNGPEGYYTELGRTVVFGAASAELKDGLEKVREAQRETVRRFVPNTPCAEIALAHDEHMQQRGLPREERLYAHGQGYSLVERPLIRADETMQVEAGMCLVAHPAYVRGGVFAYICDNYIIHHSAPAEPIHSTAQKIFEI